MLPAVEARTRIKIRIPIAMTAAHHQLLLNRPESEDPACHDKSTLEHDTMKELESDDMNRENRDGVDVRCVRFDESRNEIHYDEVDDFDKEEYYYSDSDYKGFEELNSGIVQRFAITNKNSKQQPGSDLDYTTVVNQVYNCCVASTVTTSADVTDLIETLSYSMRSSFMLRGLEMWSIPGIAEKRRKRKEAQVRAVVHLQHHLATQRNPENIRTTSRDLSKPSVLFAQTMAAADALSLEEEFIIESTTTYTTAAAAQQRDDDNNDIDRFRRRSLFDKVREKMRRRFSPSRKGRRISL